MKEITVKLLKTIKHTFRNITNSKAIRFHFTMQYQLFRSHRKWRRLTKVLLIKDNYQGRDFFDNSLVNST